MIETLDQLYDETVKCTACKLRQGCTQVVPGIGQRTNPTLVIVGEAPGQQEDEAGEPFIGQAGQLLRKFLRETKVIKPGNTLITNILKCRPPGNKFPKDESADICVSKWIWEELRIAQPKRMLLVGGTPLKYLLNLDGITNCRGQWYNVRGIRTMVTFHPSYVSRMNSTGNMLYQTQFERDINEVAEEMKQFLQQEEEAQAQEGKSIEL